MAINSKNNNNFLALEYMFSEERVSIEFDVTCVQIKIRVSVKMNSKWRGRVLDLSSVGQIMKAS